MTPGEDTAVAHGEALVSPEVERYERHAQSNDEEVERLASAQRREELIRRMGETAAELLAMDGKQATARHSPTPDRDEGVKAKIREVKEWAARKGYLHVKNACIDAIDALSAPASPACQRCAELEHELREAEGALAVLERESARAGKERHP